MAKSPNVGTLYSYADTLASQKVAIVRNLCGDVTLNDATSAVVDSKNVMCQPLVLECADGALIADTNEIARFIASQSSSSAGKTLAAGGDAFSLAKLSELLELDDALLGAHVERWAANASSGVCSKCVGSEAQVRQGLAALQGVAVTAAAAGSNSLVDGSGGVTVADVCLWVSLLPVFAADGIALPGVGADFPALKAWFGALAKESAFAAVPTSDAAVAGFVSAAMALREVRRSSPRPAGGSSTGGNTGNNSNSSSSSGSDGKDCASAGPQARPASSRPAATYHLAPLPSKPIYITTPIYYVNGEPHIGHVYTTVLADTAARWYRRRGAQVHFVTGTDEHGQKVAQSAEKQGVQPKQFCDRVSGLFRALFDKLDLAYDSFIRTTDPEHAEAVLSMWDRLFAAGHIFKGTHAGWYSVSDEQFLTEKQVVEGTDPKTGEQCKVSSESGHRVTWMEEENYKFRLSQFQQPLLDWIDANPECILPAYRRREIRAFVEGGLLDLSVSRTTVTWGIQIVQDPKHTMYVWLDALTNYLTTAGFPVRDGGRPLWPADYHVVGKDILRFHAVYWPAFLIGAGLPLPRRIVAHGWWTRNSTKISKSLGNAFDPLEEADKYGIDALRFYLLKVGTLGADGDYSDVVMKTVVNSDLADTYGNLVSRAVSRSLLKDGLWPPHGDFSVEDRAVIAQVDALYAHCDHHYERFDTREAITAVWEAVSEVNRYLTTFEPWKLRKRDAARANTVMYVVMEAVRVCAMLSAPAMPHVSERVFDWLGVPADARGGRGGCDAHFRFGLMQPGQPLGPKPAPGEVLFQKVE